MTSREGYAGESPWWDFRQNPHERAKRELSQTTKTHAAVAAAPAGELYEDTGASQRRPVQAHAATESGAQVATSVRHVQGQQGPVVHVETAATGPLDVREMERLQDEVATLPHGLFPSMATAAHALGQIPQITATAAAAGAETAGLAWEQPEQTLQAAQAAMQAGREAAEMLVADRGDVLAAAQHVAEAAQEIGEIAGAHPRQTKEALSEAQQAATDLGTGVSGPNAAKVVEGAAEGTDAAGTAGQEAWSSPWDTLGVIKHSARAALRAVLVPVKHPIRAARSLWDSVRAGTGVSRLAWSEPKQARAAAVALGEAAQEFGAVTGEAVTAASQMPGGRVGQMLVLALVLPFVMAGTAVGLVYGSTVELGRRLLDTTLRMLATAIAAAAAVLAWRFCADTSLAWGTTPAPAEGGTREERRGLLTGVLEEGADMLSSVAGVIHMRRNSPAQKQQQAPAAAAAATAAVAASGPPTKGATVAAEPQGPVAMKGGGPEDPAQTLVLSSARDALLMGRQREAEAVAERAREAGMPMAVLKEAVKEAGEVVTSTIAKAGHRTRKGLRRFAFWVRHPRSQPTEEGAGAPEEAEAKHERAERQRYPKPKGRVAHEWRPPAAAPAPVRAATSSKAASTGASGPTGGSQPTAQASNLTGGYAGGDEGGAGSGSQQWRQGSMSRRHKSEGSFQAAGGGEGGQHEPGPVPAGAGTAAGTAGSSVEGAEGMATGTSHTSGAGSSSYAPSPDRHKASPGPQRRPTLTGSDSNLLSWGRGRPAVPRTDSITTATSSSVSVGGVVWTPAGPLLPLLALGLQGGPYEISTQFTGAGAGGAAAGVEVEQGYQPLAQQQQQQLQLERQQHAWREAAGVMKEDEGEEGDRERGTERMGKGGAQQGAETGSTGARGASGVFQAAAELAPVTGAATPSSPSAPPGPKAPAAGYAAAPAGPVEAVPYGAGAAEGMTAPQVPPRQAAVPAGTPAPRPVHELSPNVLPRPAAAEAAEALFIATAPPREASETTWAEVTLSRVRSLFDTCMEVMAAVQAASLDSWTAVQQAWEGSGAPAPAAGAAGSRGFFGGAGWGWWGEWRRPAWPSHTEPVTKAHQQQQQLAEKEEQEQQQKTKRGGGKKEEEEEEGSGQTERSEVRLKVERVLTLLFQPPVLVTALWLASMDTALWWAVTTWRRFWGVTSPTAAGSRVTGSSANTARAAGVLT